ncbi:MAG TPA: hypothetical protein VKI01_12130 [Acidimicrobiia bacterium]|nr:hypothetical protein [Acidimicrobiia bacterium]
MPVPVPDTDTVVLTPPDADEVTAMARGFASAVAPAGGLTDFQRTLIEATVHAMTGQRVDLRSYTPMSALEFATLMARRELAFRSRMIQAMLTPALVLRPLPEEVADRIAAFAYELGVDEAMVDIAREFSHGALGLAAFDFDRNGYTKDWAPEDADALHTSRALATAWDVDVSDPALAARWSALEHLPAGTLGRRVWEMYRARGFAFPGLPGSAPPLLAQHDWVHVLADYGTTVEAELEVFAFIARANDDMRAYSLLAMVLSLFETGYLRTGAGMFQSDTGHLSQSRDMALRFADALRRGALGTDRETNSDSIDYLRLDWFDLAGKSLADARARFHVVPKSDEALAAGSVGPWQPGGISPFQERSGRELARREGRPYESYGARTSAD